MARVKISELNAKTTAEDTDLLPIVDTTSEETKKISVGDLLQNYEIKGDVVVTREPEPFETSTIPMSYFEGCSSYEILYLESYQSGLQYKGFLHTTGKLPFKINGQVRPGILEFFDYSAGDTNTLIRYWRGVYTRDDTDYMIISNCSYIRLPDGAHGTTQNCVLPVIIIGYK